MSLGIDDATDQSMTVNAVAITEVSSAAVGKAADLDGGDRTAEEGDAESPVPQRSRFRRIRWRSVFAYGVLPLVAMLLAASAGYLKWVDDSAAQSRAAAIQSVQVASDTTVAMLAYRPDTVEKDLTAAAGRLTGGFRDDYLKLVKDIVIPGSKEKRIATAVTVQAAASVSASNSHAVVLLFVNQTTTIADATPTNSLSSVRVTLDNVGGRWLVSQFEPV